MQFLCGQPAPRRISAGMNFWGQCRHANSSRPRNVTYPLGILHSFGRGVVEGLTGGLSQGRVLLNDSRSMQVVFISRTACLLSSSTVSRQHSTSSAMPQRRLVFQFRAVLFSIVAFPGFHWFPIGLEQRNVG